LLTVAKSGSTLVNTWGSTHTRSGNSSLQET
jgi:hypothetical protein